MKNISIITINLNNVEGLRTTMNSVFQQSYSDFEYIVIDGGSNDGSAKLIENSVDKIDYWVTETDTGIYNAMNKGLLQAKGRYVLFLNSGDYLYDRNVLSSAADELNGEDLIYGNLYEGVEGNWKLTVFPDSLNLWYMMQYYLGHPSTFIRKDLFVNDKYSEDLKIAADWEFFFKKIVMDGCTYKHLNRAISVYDLNGISATSAGLGDAERELILNRLLPPILCDEIKCIQEIRKSPFMELIPRLNKTKTFQYRVKSFVEFLLKIEDLITQRKP